MKFRAICFGMVFLVASTAGCLPYHRHPCWGFRLHPCQNGGACAPVCSSPISHKLHACSPCMDGPTVITTPGYPVGAAGPMIGQPIPLPAPRVVPPGETTPSPMPVKPSGY